MNVSTAKPDNVGNTTPATPTDPEVAALTIEKERARLRKEIAESEKSRILAEKEALKAQVPSSETKGASGNVTLVSKGGYHAEVMAFQTLRPAAKKIADAVPLPAGVTDPTVIVPTLYLSEKGLMVARVEELMAQMHELGKDQERVQKIVQSRLDLLPIKNRELQNEQSKQTEIKNSLDLRKKALANLEKASAPDQSTIKEAKLDIQQIEAEFDSVTAVIMSLEHEIFDLTRDQSEWNALNDPADEALETASSYVDMLTKASGDTPTPLTTLRQIDLILSHPEATIVAIDLVSQGAEVHVTKSAWNTRLSYAGGSVSLYFVVGPDNNLITSGTVPSALTRTLKTKEFDRATIKP